MIIWITALTCFLSYFRLLPFLFIISSSNGYVMQWQYISANATPHAVSIFLPSNSGDLLAIRCCYRADGPLAFRALYFTMIGPPRREHTVAGHWFPLSRFDTYFRRPAIPTYSREVHASGRDFDIKVKATAARRRRWPPHAGHTTTSFQVDYARF